MQKETDIYMGWDIPRRQSAAAIFIMLLKTAVELLKMLWPGLILFIFSDDEDENDSPKVLIILALFFILTCIVTFIKFWFYKFYIHQNNLVIQSGWLKKKTLTVPLQNIQEVHFEQNVLQRILKVVTITIDSAGSGVTEAKIDALSHGQAETLKAILLSHQGNSNTVTGDIPIAKNVIRLSNGDLFRFSISANHFEAFVIIAGLSMNVLEDIKEAFKVDSWGLMKGAFAEAASQTAVMITVLAIAAALISIFVSIIRTMLKFYNFTMEDTINGWKISHGLINQQQKIVPSDKIQILVWKANWLRLKLNFWIVHVMSIGQSRSATKEHIQIPVTSHEKILSLTPVYQRSHVFNHSYGLGIQKDYWWQKTLFTGAPVTAILTLIFYFWFDIAGMAILLLIFYFAWFYFKYYKIFRWQFNHEGVQLYSGVWRRKYSLMTWKKIQQVNLHQTPYQRKHQLASIVFVTAGGHVSIPYIPLKDAADLVNLALYYVESRNEEWM